MEKQIAQTIDLLEEKRFPNSAICQFVTRNLRALNEDELSEYQIERDAVFSTVEKDYYENEWPRVQESVKAMIQEISEGERFEAKRASLLALLRTARKENDLPKIKKLAFEIKVLLGRAEGFSPEQIEEASKYPIEHLIKNVRGMALCPFHPDKTASMDVRKGFYYCYGCGEYGNAIKFLMKRDGLTFPQAVLKLTHPV